MKRYLVLSGGDFEVFRPAGATRGGTDWGETWRGGVDLFQKVFKQRSK